MLCGPGVKAVEWAERLKIPVEEALWLEIRRTASPTGRELVERPAKTELGRGDE